MDEETKNRLEKLEIKLDAIWRSVEKTRKYFFVTLWVTLIAFILPLILLLFLAPFFLAKYAAMLKIVQ